jgi:hypothetical protein
MDHLKKRVLVERIEEACERRVRIIYEGPKSPGFYVNAEGVLEERKRTRAVSVGFVKESCLGDQGYLLIMEETGDIIVPRTIYFEQIINVEYES